MKILYPDNYGIYVDLLNNHDILINSIDINNESLDYHYTSILNIMKDYIEKLTEIKSFIKINFGDIVIDLNIVDYHVNLIMWKLLCSINIPIRPNDIFFNEAITKRSIKNYIDEKFLKNNITKYPNILLNNIIDDCLVKFNDIDQFSFYLCNTINLEDDINLINKYPELYDLYHTDLSTIPIEDVKHVGMELTNKLIGYIKNSDHWGRPFFKSQEGMNVKQYRECYINIGPKPNGFGQIYDTIINNSFLMGGVNTEDYYLTECGASRIAQIIVDNNTGNSGHFARILGLNNINTHIHHDSTYDCHTKNFVKITIEDENMLTKFENRYFRFYEDGIEFKITSDSKDIIGKEILLRSPITCASHANGNGICYKCYGDLAYLNKDINIGKMAAEILSSQVTQRMLSAKHLLEANIVPFKWSSNFNKFFKLDYNQIILSNNIDLTDYKLSINLDNINLDEDDDVEYIFDFEIISPNGEVLKIYSEDSDMLFITIELNEVIREYSNSKDSIVLIDMNELLEIPLFTITIHNNELSVILDNIKGYINKTKKIEECNNDKDLLLIQLIKVLIEGGININSVHIEIILSNQIRDITDPLNKPNWLYSNASYEIVTLEKALKENPSITIGLSFEDINRILYNPLTYRKTKASAYDMFFMENYKQYIESEVPEDDNNENKEKIKLCTFNKRKLCTFNKNTEEK